jgi:subtilisin family serine protease
MRYAYIFVLQIFWIACCVNSAYSYSSEYSYISNHNQKLYSFKPDFEHIQVRFNKVLTDGEVDSFARSYNLFPYKIAPQKRYAVFRVSSSKTYEQAAAEIMKSGVVRACFPLLIDEEGFEKTFMPDELTVQFAAGLRDEAMVAAIRGCRSRVIGRQWTRGYYTISVPEGMSSVRAIQEFNKMSGVLFAEFSGISFDDFCFPNDPLFPKQWAHNNTGQTGGTPGSDMDTPYGWLLEKGDPDVVIVIIDSGCDLDHEDLRDKILPRGEEDWDFSDSLSKIPEDSYGHGTCCSGIAGASVNNGIGVAGTAPGCMLMPLKIDLASGMNQNRADAINYAISRKTLYKQMVISCSWRMSGGSYVAVEEACRNAWENGVLITAAAGNNNTSTIDYPANYETVIAVGATSDCDERKSPASCDGETFWGSNFGAELDVVAPGVHVMTTDIEGGLGFWSGNYYPKFNGTSAACPHAAGVIALIWSANPGLTCAEVKEILESTADDTVGPSWEDTPGWDPYMGWGRINAANAVQEAIRRLKGLKVIAAKTPDSANAGE